jgi:hypothetical protein
MIETLLGGLLGGAFRLAPEVLRLLDRAAERRHAQRMQEFARATARGLDGSEACPTPYPPSTPQPCPHDSALPEPAHSDVPWVDALSSSVRPVITYWFMALYCAAKTAAFVAAIEGGADWGVAILHAWTEADQALWAGVLNFWFLGRVFDRVRP